MRSRVGERIFRVVYVHIGPMSTQLTLIALAFLAADRSESDCQPSSLTPENTSHSGFYAHSCWIAIDASRCKVGSENESGCCILSSDVAIRRPGHRSHPDSNWGTWKLTFLMLVQRLLREAQATTGHRTGTYSSPVRHSASMSTESLRATAMTALRFAMAPPRAMIRSP